MLLDIGHVEKRMAFFDHFDELRVRLLRCLSIFMGGMVISYFFLVEPILIWLRKPLFNALPEMSRQLYFTNLFENFLTHLKVAGYSGVMLFSPLYFLQIWGFIRPALHEREQRLVVPFVVAATVFSLGELFLPIT